MMNDWTENGYSPLSADQPVRIWDARQVNTAEQHIAEAGEILRKGGIVAFPTETVYGLGADAGNSAAVEAVFAAKGRPSDNPLIVHISQLEQLDRLVTNVKPVERELMEQFWPGPLTLVMPVQPGAVSPYVTAGLDTVGVRMPDHPVALRLITAAGCPLAAPSANRSGRPSPTTAEHVAEDLSSRIQGIVDGGSAGVGVESTVIQVQEDGAVLILRPGGITEDQLLTVASSVMTDPGLSGLSADTAPRAPGMKYAHYAPRGSMTIVLGEDHDAVRHHIHEQLHQAEEHGEHTGVLRFEEDQDDYGTALQLSLGSRYTPEVAASRLYACLRTLDAHGITFIMATGCSEQGVGAAVMNRLSKAAGGRMIHV
ncbi:L-threonylcarbamoyladenylate synthase [Paenibacillus sp. Z6-24]